MKLNRKQADAFLFVFPLLMSLAHIWASWVGVFPPGFAANAAALFGTVAVMYALFYRKKFPPETHLLTLPNAVITYSIENKLTFDRVGGKNEVAAKLTQALKTNPKINLVPLGSTLGITIHKVDRPPSKKITDDVVILGE